MKIDLVGYSHGMLTVTGYAFNFKKKNYWFCLCECGKTTILRSSIIKKQFSCGCFQNSPITQIKHGMRYTRFYKIWRGMKNRCCNKNDGNFKQYGGRGIKCTAWMSFDAFMKDMYKSYAAHVKKYGEKQTTIDRIDNHRGYDRNNCRWATYSEQLRNRRPYSISKTRNRRPYSTSKTGESVYQYDAVSGKLIGKFISIMEAQRKTGIHNSVICRKLNGRRKQSGDFIWSLSPLG